MTTSPRIDAAAARRAAQAALDARISSVDAAVEAANHAHRLAEDLAQAETAAARAYADAQRAGWTSDELKRIGLTAPTATARKRAPRRRAAASETPAAGDEQH